MGKLTINEWKSVAIIVILILIAIIFIGATIYISYSAGYFNGAVEGIQFQCLQDVIENISR